MVGRISAAAAVAVVIAIFSFASFAVAENPRLKFVSGDVEGYIRGGQCAPEVDLIIVSPTPEFYTARDNPVFRFVRGAKLSLQFECAGDDRISTIQIYGYVGEELVYRADTLIGSNSSLRNIRFLGQGSSITKEARSEAQRGAKGGTYIQTESIDDGLRPLRSFIFSVLIWTLVGFLSLLLLSRTAVPIIRPISAVLYRAGFLDRPLRQASLIKPRDIVISAGVSISLFGSIVLIAILAHDLHQLSQGNIGKTYFGLATSEVYTVFIPVAIGFFASLISIQNARQPNSNDVELVSFNWGLVYIMSLFDAFADNSEEVFDLVNEIFDYQLGQTTKNIIVRSDFSADAFLSPLTKSLKSDIFAHKEYYVIFQKKERGQRNYYYSKKDQIPILKKLTPAPI